MSDSNDKLARANLPRVTQSAIGERVRQLRYARELTVDQFARLSNLLPSVIRSIERGCAKPSPCELVALAMVCDTSVDYLLVGQGKRFRRGSIGELLRSTGLSASELGRKIGVSRQAVWAYGQGVTVPQFATVLKLAETFNKTLSFFVESQTGEIESRERATE